MKAVLLKIGSMAIGFIAVYALTKDVLLAVGANLTCALIAGYFSRAVE